MRDLIDRQEAINALHDEIVRRRISEDANDGGALDEFDTEAILRRLPSAEPEQRWIPVTERLPGEDDYRPCYGYEDGAVWWVNDMGLMGLGWYCPSTGKWAYFDESDRCEKYVGNVVAWMPLPMAYKEGA